MKEKLQETKIDSNKKNVTYLSNLFLTEHQQRIHRRIKHHTNQSKSSGIKYIRIPIDKPISWNSIPSSLPDDQWEK